MYEPGGATLAFDGPSTLTPAALACTSSGMKRWSMSRLCVTEPMRTSDTDRIRAASGVLDVERLAVADSAPGALVMVGRAPLNR